MESITLSATQSQQLKMCQMEMLKAFAAVCDELGVKYFLEGGTLIGAVRHKGFIPWDDDVDVVMLRRDYERFVRDGQKHLPEHYFIQTMDTDPAYPANFAKIRDSRTTFIETTVAHKRMNHGAYIDVFVLDYYPEKVLAQRWMEFRRMVMKARQSIDYYRPDEGWSAKRVLRSVLGNLSRLFYPSVPRLLKQREAMYRAVPPGPKLCNYSGIYGKKEIQPAEWYEEFCELEFEGALFKAPKRWHEVLTNFYGDYMQLPPEEERVGHHYALAVDLERPYTEYMDMLCLRQKGKDRRDGYVRI